ncbi:hypothetical protein ABIF78_007667 [Bradyrhizobium japonicum]
MTEGRIDYQIQHIAVKHLSVVWVESQRPYKESEARLIADNFDPDLFDPLKVTKPNGNGIFHICDGQHRKGAVEMLWGSDQMVPCHVSPEGDPKRAAEIFLKTNTARRPPTSIDHFKVSVVAELKNEVAIDRIVRHNGFRVDGGQSKEAISAVSSLRNIFSVCGPQVLDQTLRVLHEIWRDDRNAVAGPILRGFGYFLNEFGPYAKHARLVDVVRKKWTPGTLLRDAKAGKEVHGGSTQASMVELLVRTYNRNLRGDTPLKRKESR